VPLLRLHTRARTHSIYNAYDSSKATFLRELALVLRYTDMACLVLIVFSQWLWVLLNLAQEGGANRSA